MSVARSRAPRGPKRPRVVKRGTCECGAEGVAFRADGGVHGMHLRGAEHQAWKAAQKPQNGAET